MKVSFQNISKQYKGKYALKDFTVMDFLLYMCTLKGIPAEQGKKRALEQFLILDPFLTFLCEKRSGR